MTDFLAVNWPEVIDVKEARAIANDLMDDWDFQKKVPQFRLELEGMETVHRVQTFLMRAITNGLVYKGKP